MSKVGKYGLIILTLSEKEKSQTNMAWHIYNLDQDGDISIGKLFKTIGKPTPNNKHGIGCRSLYPPGDHFGKQVLAISMTKLFGIDRGNMRHSDQLRTSLLQRWAGQRLNIWFVLVNQPDSEIFYNIRYRKIIRWRNIWFIGYAWH